MANCYFVMTIPWWLGKIPSVSHFLPQNGLLRLWLSEHFYVFCSAMFCPLFSFHLCLYSFHLCAWPWGQHAGMKVGGKEGSLDECKICHSIWDAAPQPAKPKGNKKQEGHSTASNLKATWRIVERGCVFKPLPPRKSIFVAPSNKQFHYFASPGEIKCHG